MILGRKTKRPTPELKDLAYHHDEDPTPEEDYNRGTAKAVRKELGIPEEAPESECRDCEICDEQDGCEPTPEGECAEANKKLEAENERLEHMCHTVNKNYGEKIVECETAQATIERVREIANIQDPRWGTSAEILADKIADALDKE